jgi:hypothetical protein
MQEIKLVTDRSELDALNVPPDIDAVMVVSGEGVKPGEQVQLAVISIKLLREVLAVYDGL